MTVSDMVRRYVYENYILPARKTGQKTIRIRSGDIHKEMELSNRFPLVISALTANKFQSEYGVKCTNHEGPMGANHYITYEI